jgi:hypothetical protein
MEPQAFFGEKRVDDFTSFLIRRISGPVIAVVHLVENINRENVRNVKLWLAFITEVRLFGAQEKANGGMFDWTLFDSSNQTTFV